MKPICRVSHHWLPWLILQLSNYVPARSISVLIYCTFSVTILHQQHRLLRAITSQQLSLYIVKQRLFTWPPGLRMFIWFWHFDININLKQLVKSQIYLYSNWNLDKYFVTLTDKVASYKTTFFCINERQTVRWYPSAKDFYIA